MKSPLTRPEGTKQSATMTIAQALQQAIAHHQAGQLQDAERLYRAILQAQPNQPDANHNLGVLAVQIKQPTESLPHFKEALEANPNLVQYWLSYIDALIQAGQTDAARQMLEQGRKRGVQGDAVEILSGRLEASSGSEPTLEKIKALAALFTEGQYTEALTLAQEMTERFPLHGFGWKVLGAVLKLMGRNTDALIPMQKAATLLQDDFEAHSNLGITLKELGRLDEAESSHRHALEIKPDYAEAHCNLGNTLKELGRLTDAESSYRQALEIKPDYADAYYNLGITLKEMGRLSEAEVSYRRALEFKPDYTEALCNLGNILKETSRLDEALACFQQQVRLSPGNEVAQHLVASLAGMNTERAPSQYVESVFDSYAERFDTHLQQILKYEAPKKLIALIMQHSALSDEKWNVLDLGCGTGLVGLAIAPFAQQLVGVDLSANMLKKAHARNLYQRLVHLDLLTMMQDEQAASYDVIIAADVFVYLGKLDEIMCEVKRLLRPSGVVAFTIEALRASLNEEAAQEFQLETTGRYTHSANYINKLASANGFLPKEMAATQIRIEQGKPVNSYLVLWKSPESHMH